MRRRLTVAGVVLWACSALCAADRTEGEMFATRSVVHARNGMVAASHPLAVQIGLDVLKAGGSAVAAPMRATKRGARACPSCMV